MSEIQFFLLEVFLSISLSLLIIVVISRPLFNILCQL